jgi:ribonuclease J
MLSVTKPKYFIPVHGEEKHLMKHAGLALGAGINKDNIIVSSIGDIIELSSRSAKITDKVQAGSILVDGLGVGDVGSIVLRDRKHLADDGIIIVAMAMESATGEVVSGPDVITRGFVYVKESEQLIDQAREAACRAVEYCYLSNIRDWTAIKGKVKDSVSKYIYEKTRRSPMVLPIIMEI